MKQTKLFLQGWKRGIDSLIEFLKEEKYIVNEEKFKAWCNKDD